MALCELCQQPSGRYNANRECCQIRLLATMPKHAREAAYDQTRLRDGKGAAEQLRDRVKAEWARLNAVRLALGKANIAKLKNIIGAT